MELHGKALLMKWLCKYSNENQTLWRRVIGAKYENEDSWMTKDCDHTLWDQFMEIHKSIMGGS
ncbi:hypothetical protein H5410_059394 [Solanum commersonii]|uniref:Uncharacterized protein n=1 Tax=Solanum commersonii TaxID=4109 RepID=A0A9J5W2T9_SOLCO|nr:hypothetical protein H5410_059394 [Solanum commersonii]